MNGIQVFLAAYAQPLIWLAVALVMLIIEAATVQMVSIWFCLGRWPRPSRRSWVVPSRCRLLYLW